jgi:ribosomal protein S18 acetylase RimI-like enzyme
VGEPRDDLAELPRYLGVVIRRATGADHAWIATLAADVYGDLGDYGSIIRSWLDHPGVRAYVDEGPAMEGGPDVLRGFILLGFYEPEEAPPGIHIADLLAIAVDRPCQRRGVGTSLLAHAVQLAGQASLSGTIRELRLTVADTNQIAQHFFRASGFHVLDEHHGHYDGGQRAIRMTRPLP